MKVVILAGGLGTRMSEITKTIPKPMVKIAGFPILIHILKHYLKHGFKNFIIAAGYKNKIIKDISFQIRKNVNADNKGYGCAGIYRIWICEDTCRCAVG